MPFWHHRNAMTSKWKLYLPTRKQDCKSYRIFTISRYISFLDLLHFWRRWHYLQTCVSRYGDRSLCLVRILMTFIVNFKIKLKYCNSFHSCVYIQFIVNILGHHSVVSYENVHFPTARPDFPGKIFVTIITYLLT